MEAVIPARGRRTPLRPRDPERHAMPGPRRAPTRAARDPRYDPYAQRSLGFLYLAAAGLNSNLNAT